ncbi:TlpA family protein disulfide reductase [Flavobacterium microcysteis]
MHNLKVFKIVSISFLSLLSLCSCEKKFKSDNFTAYFGGEVSNPLNRYVLFLKDNKVIDTIPLDRNNRFFKKFDSLAPGLYTFKHEPEYQYVYFDKNDSIMVRMNSSDFDESVVFCGRGEEKNNFLMEMYLKNEEDRDKMFTVFDYDLNKFTKYIDSAYHSRKSYYNSKKELLKWNDDFDIYALASLDFPYYTKKEIYPVIHEIRTGENVSEKLPKDFYQYRDEIDYNNKGLTNFSPFVKYLTYMLNNMAIEKADPNASPEDKALEMNITKLNIADTLFKNPEIKNAILDNIAFAYLLEDQHILNNKKFLDRYNELSTDKGNQNEITKIGDAIQMLKGGNPLPNVDLIGLDGETVSSESIIKGKTVIFFWTENAKAHFETAHKKAMELKAKHPGYNFIAINVDDNQSKWKNNLSKYKFEKIEEFRVKDFEELKQKWVITKIHRAIITNADGTINNAFVNLFDVKFVDYLK